MIIDIFSKRQKALRGDVPDVYSYDKIPHPLKVQVIQIWREALGDQERYENSHFLTRQAYTFIVEALCREYGVFVLPGSQEYKSRNYRVELENFLMLEQDPEKAVDAIEMSFICVDRMTRDSNYFHITNYDELADEAIASPRLFRHSSREAP